MYIDILYSLGGILIPFIGTTIGSSFVFFLKNNLNNKLEKLIIGISIGVMLAASIWSLILPSLDNSTNLGSLSWMPTAIGFVLGIFFLIIVNYLSEECIEKKNSKKIDMLMFSVTLHNIPEDCIKYVSQEI